MLSGWSLKAKLLVLTLMMTAVSLIVGASGYWVLQSVETEYKHVTQINMPNLANISDIRAHFKGISIELRTLAIDGLTEQQIQTQEQAVLKEMNSYENAVKAYLNVPFEAGEEELFRKVETIWKEFRSVAELKMQWATSKNPADRVLFKEFIILTYPEVATRFQNALDELVQFQNRESLRWAKSAEAKGRFGTWVSILVIAIGTAFSIGAGLWFATWLSRSIGRVVEDLSDGAEQVATASVHISSASAQLSSASTQQAASLQETSAAVNEMSSMTSRNAENASKAAEKALEGQNKAAIGQQAVHEMLSSISEIDQSTESIATQIEESNKEIGSIIKIIADIQDKTQVINDIVFQTKLLSFNASVEAARAGEHGKGFSVVAEEIGNLAQMSGNAAKEISHLLSSSMEGVDRTIQSTQRKVSGLMEASKSKVQSGNEVAKRCGQSFTELVEAISSINQMVSEIANASQEQSTGIVEINQAVRQLDQVTQQNSASAEESSSSSIQLADQAKTLRALVVELRQMVEGSHDSGVRSNVSSIKHKHQESASNHSKAA